MPKAPMENRWLAFKHQPKHLPTGISFKAVSQSDMAFLSDLYISTRWQEVMQAPWDDQQRLEFLSQQFMAQHTHYESHYPHAEKLLIVKENHNIGRIYIDRDESSICLIDVALITEHRGNGLGTQLLRELLNEAQLADKKIVIHVENFNPAYHWYVKHGFKQIEDKGVYQYMEWYPNPSNQKQA